MQGIVRLLCIWQRAPDKAMKTICALYFLGCLWMPFAVYADDGASVEYKIKAGYLYNFTKFITWSADDTETFNVCIVGSDPFGDLIDPIEQRTVAGRAIKLLRLEDFRGVDDNGPHCHILFVSATLNNKLAANRGLSNTLVVGDKDDFIERGGMIGFVTKQGKIKLQINLDNIKQGGLRISAKLLEVADSVMGESHDQ